MTLRPGQILTLAAGVVLVVFSFFAFVEFEVDDDDADAATAECEFLEDLSSSDVSRSQRDELAARKAICSILDDGASAWNTDLTFPLATLPAIIGLVVAGIVAASTFGSLEPPTVAGFSPPQLLVGLATSGALIMMGFLVDGNEDGSTWGIGFWFMLVGSIALLVGTVMELLQGPHAAGQAGYGGVGGQGYGAPPQGPHGGYPPAGGGFPPAGGYPPPGAPPGPAGPPPGPAGPPGPGGYSPPSPPPPGQSGPY